MIRFPSMNTVYPAFSTIENATSRCVTDVTKSFFKKDGLMFDIEPVE